MLKRDVEVVQNTALSVLKNSLIMSRRRRAVKRPTMPDPRHGSPLISTLVNAVMQSGKKALAQRIVYGAIEKMAEKEWAIYVTNLAWKNVQSEVSDTQKAIFTMTLDGKTRPEIAEALDIPLNTVSVYKRRVTAILQKEIKRLEKSLH